jgi:hypothetical protein
MSSCDKALEILAQLKASVEKLKSLLEKQAETQ